MKSDSFIFDGAAKLANLLSHISYFSVVRWSLGKFGYEISYFFVDCWVLGWFACAVLSSFIVIELYHPYLYAAIIIVSSIRILEMITYQMNVLMFHPRSSKGISPLRGYRRSIILVIINYFEIIFWFTAYYLISRISGYISIEQFSILTVFRESLLFMVGNSTNAFTFNSLCPLVLATLQNVIGLFMTIVVLAHFVSLLPRRPTLDEEEKQD